MQSPITFRYKGYTGSVDYSFEDSVYHGKLEGITDLVTYESPDLESLRVEFVKAVKNYEDWLEELERELKGE